MGSEYLTRYATKEDAGEIVSLLRLSLGESLLPKTVEYWNWKHNCNPFGDSLVLVAEQEGALIGVRSFMKWSWKLGNRTINAVRGVDTAVRPEFQGRNLFGRMTLELAERSRSEGFEFLFSTPNPKSKGAYGKIGWSSAERFWVKVRIRKPLNVFSNLITQRRDDTGKHFVDDSIASYLDRPDLAALLTSHYKLFPHYVLTAHSVKTLEWRYLTVPVGAYYAIGIDDGELNSLCFYRLKPSKLGLEMRITDFFVKSLNYLKDLSDSIRYTARERDADFVTVNSRGEGCPLARFFPITMKYPGPTVTIRNLQETNGGFSRFLSQWSPSLGDLELF